MCAADTTRLRSSVPGAREGPSHTYLFGIRPELKLRTARAQLNTFPGREYNSAKHSLPIDERAVTAAQIHDEVPDRLFVCSDNLQVLTAHEIIGFLISHMAIPVTAENDLALGRERESVQ